MSIKTAKEKLLDAALDIFAEHGFKGTSTRMLSKKSGVNVAGIGYYYGGKKALYHAVIEHMSAEFLNLVEPLISFVELNIENADSAQARAILLKLLIGISASTQNPKMSKFSLIAVKEQNNPTDAFEIFYNSSTVLVFKIIRKCLQKIAPEKSDDYYVILAQTLAAQATLFLVFKENLRRSLSVEKFTETQLQLHKEILEQSINSIN